MEAASGGVWTGQIGREIAFFVIGQILLHTGLGRPRLGPWPIASAVIWQTAREKFGRIVVGWFCLVVAAVIAYNAYWFPRTGLGAYYHDTLATMVGPLPLGRVIYLGVVAAAVLMIVAATCRVAASAAVPARSKAGGTGDCRRGAGIRCHARGRRPSGHGGGAGGDAPKRHFARHRFAAAGGTAPIWRDGDNAAPR